eukprot:IDg7484t1
MPTGSLRNSIAGMHYGFVVRGEDNEQGWNGKFDIEVYFETKPVTFNSPVMLEMDGKLRVRFYGTYKGEKINTIINAAISYVVGHDGKLGFSGNATFVQNLGGKKTTFSMVSKIINRDFTIEISLVHIGQKYSFTFRGPIGDLWRQLAKILSLLQFEMTNSIFHLAPKMTNHATE